MSRNAFTECERDYNQSIEQREHAAHERKSMKPQHTPEPWPVFTNVAMMMTPDPEVVPVAVLSRDDYIRARACVNACSGVTNPDDYEFARVLKLADEQRTACLKYEQQRDEILAKASALMEFVVGELPRTGYMRDNDKSRAAIGELRAAIANIKENT